MIYRYPTVVLVYTQVYYLCSIPALLRNQLPLHWKYHNYCLNNHLISSLPQDYPSTHPECNLHLLHLHNYIYISPDGNFYFFQYLLVAHPFLPDKYPQPNKSPHQKYPPRCIFLINIPHLCFVTFVLFGDGQLLPNQHQGN